MKRLLVTSLLACVIMPCVVKAGVIFIRNEDQIFEYAKTKKGNYIATKEAEIADLKMKQKSSKSTKERADISRKVRDLEKHLRSITKEKIDPSSFARPLVHAKIGQLWVADQPRMLGNTINDSYSGDFKVLSRADDQNLLVLYRITQDDLGATLRDGNVVQQKTTISDTLYWIRGVDASKIVDGEIVCLKGLFKLTGTQEYTSAIGAKKTAIVIEPYKLPDQNQTALERIPQIKGNVTTDDSAMQAPITNSVGMKLIPVSAGEFLMGSALDDPDAQKDEMPQRRVRIADSFLIGAYEVTREQYAKVMGQAIPSQRTIHHAQGNLSWNDAVDFCQTLSELPAEKAAGRTYRLPTEAEWEYACRAGTSMPYYFGETSHRLLEYARTVNQGYVEDVGTQKPNAWGLYDMQGNATEWCSDWYSATFYQSPNNANDPVGPSIGRERVHRGSNPGSPPKDSRSAARWHFVPDKRYPTLGLRVVCELE